VGQIRGGKSTRNHVVRDQVRIKSPEQGTEETKEKQHDQEYTANNRGTVPDKTIEDNTSLTSPFLHQFWSHVQKGFNLFL
jgi:hypothetical protein